MRLLLGFGVLRDYSEQDTRGSGFVAYPHMLYATREAAERAVDGPCRVVEVYTDITEDPNP
jgi:hypothetical protein